MKQKTNLFGICDYCKDEYDTPKPSKIYLFRGKHMCGDCCNQTIGDENFNEMSYGSD